MVSLASIVAIRCEERKRDGEAFLATCLEGEVERRQDAVSDQAACVLPHFYFRARVNALGICKCYPDPVIMRIAGKLTVQGTLN